MQTNQRDMAVSVKKSFIRNEAVESLANKSVGVVLIAVIAESLAERILDYNTALTPELIVFIGQLVFLAVGIAMAGVFWKTARPKAESVGKLFTPVQTTVFILFGIFSGFAVSVLTLPGTPGGNDAMDTSLPMVIAAVCAMAVSQEVLFRGILLQRLRQFGDLFAVISTALLYGLLAGGVSVFPFYMGLCTGILCVKNQSIVASVLYRVVNGIVATYWLGFLPSVVGNGLSEFVLSLVLASALLLALICLRVPQLLYGAVKAPNPSLKGNLLTFLTSAGMLWIYFIAGMGLVLSLMQWV